MNLVALYLMATAHLKDYMADRRGNEQTGMLLNIVITVVIAGLVLAFAREFIEDLWTQITGQISNLWSP